MSSPPTTRRPQRPRAVDLALEPRVYAGNRIHSRRRRMEGAARRWGTYYRCVARTLGPDEPISPDMEDASDEETDLLLAAADLVTLARTGVEFDYQGDVIDAHAPEMPTRFAKQLVQVMRGACAIGLDRTEALRAGHAPRRSRKVVGLGRNGGRSRLRRNSPSCRIPRIPDNPHRHGRDGWTGRDRHRHHHRRHTRQGRSTPDTVRPTGERALQTQR
jgi:hypothetical protein